jgi:four helix bundle protein
MPPKHTNLVAWQRADDLFIEVHTLVRQHFPPEERFELSSQLRRAAYSVPANIVEGLARRTPRDQARFLNLAEASLAEVGYCLHSAKRLGYIDNELYALVDRHVRQVAAPLVGLLRSL